MTTSTNNGAEIHKCYGSTHSKKQWVKDDKENFHALHDLGLFMGNVIHRANSMGIAVHQMAGVQFKKAHSEFQFSDDYHVATAVAFGYYGANAEELPEDLKKDEIQVLRKRRRQQDFAFNGNFQNKE
ncbi:MAG: nitroreductase family protein [Aequorivita sp.]